MNKSSKITRKVTTAPRNVSAPRPARAAGVEKSMITDLDTARRQLLSGEMDPVAAYNLGRIVRDTMAVIREPRMRKQSRIQERSLAFRERRGA